MYMYVYIYVYIYIYMYVYMCNCPYLGGLICVPIYVYTYIGTSSVNGTIEVVATQGKVRDRVSIESQPLLMKIAQ